MPVPPVPFPVNYCNDNFPLLSFAYAVYCGGNTQSGVMEYENKQVRASLNLVANYVPGTLPSVAVAQDPAVYRGYLDYYTTNQARRFPGASQQVVSVEVISNDVPFWNPPLNITRPKPQQCSTYVQELVLELQGAAVPQALPGENVAVNNAPRPPRKNASRNDFRPMLSCLAVIFLNDDASFRQNPAAFLADYELSAAAVAALTAYGQRLAGVVGPIPAAGPWMTAAETGAVAADLVNDMSKLGSIFW